MFSKVALEAKLTHKDGDPMRKSALPACLLLILLAAQATAGANHKIAVHVLPHANRNCNSLPGIQGCNDIKYTHDGCGDVDVFPVAYDLSGVTAVEVGLTWPDSWGSCAFTPCGFDLLMSEIVYPGDWLSGAWTECQYVRAVVVGFGWLAPTSGGRICPSPNPLGFMGVTDCEFIQLEFAAAYCAGVCGMDGENPCGGGVSEDKTWGSIKSMYR